MSAKRKSRPKSAPRAKPERKPKVAGKPKGPPKAKGKSATAASPKAPPVHPEPTEEGEAGKRELRYGGFELRLFDHDMHDGLPAVYGGKLRKVILAGTVGVKAASGTVMAPPDAKAVPGTAAASTVANVQDQDTRMVAKLRSDLWRLGFWVFPRTKDDVIAPEESGAFDWRVEWAVREFQIAASMPYVAVEDVNKKPVKPEEKEEMAFKGKRLFRLSQKPNKYEFDEPPTGVVTAKTAKAIGFWLDSKNNYRCPLVIQAMKVKDLKKKDYTPVAAYMENIWRYDELPNATYKMHAWDFSGHYKLPEGSRSECIAVGDYQKYMSWTGPCSVPGKDQCWGEAEVAPENLLGKDWGPANLTAAETSTFRVVAAVAEQECRGFLDSVNFYDNCLGSAGPCHWTGPKDTTDHKAKTPNIGPGELCGFMAYLEAEYPEAFGKCFADLGVWGPIWGKAPSGKKDLEGRRWSGMGDTPNGYVYVKKWIDPKEPDKKFAQVPDLASAQRSFEESTWLKSWTWTYRLEMAARTIPEFRKAMWQFAARRIERIRQMDHIGNWVPDVVEGDGTTRKARMSDIITSEQGMAVLLRLHVRGPALLSNSAGAKAPLHNALKQVVKTDLFRGKDPSGKPGAPLPPNKWDTDHEVALVDAILANAKVPKGVAGTARQARFWPFNAQVPDGKKGAPTPYKTHTWFPLVEELVEVTVKLKGKKEKKEIKKQVPTEELQPRMDRGSLAFPP